MIRLSRAALARLPLLLLLLLGVSLGAAAEKRYAPDGIGAGGYDPVAYFTDGKAMRGLEQMTAEHGGVTYRFASAEHRDLFQAAPEKYLPRYGGFCAYAAAKGSLAKTDPEAFSVVDGKLYLNFSKDVRERWLQHPAEYIAEADKRWPKLAAE